VETKPKEANSIKKKEENAIPLVTEKVADKVTADKVTAEKVTEKTVEKNTVESDSVQEEVLPKRDELLRRQSFHKLASEAIARRASLHSVKKNEMVIDANKKDDSDSTMTLSSPITTTTATPTTSTNNDNNDDNDDDDNDNDIDDGEELDNEDAKNSDPEEETIDEQNMTMNNSNHDLKLNVDQTLFEEENTTESSSSSCTSTSTLAAKTSTLPSLTPEEVIAATAVRRLKKEYSYDDLRRKLVKLNPSSPHARRQSVKHQFSQEIMSSFADREDLLNDGEFEKIFSMSKDKFKELPKWRRQELKKRFKLF
jgi:hypothetical protein